MDSTTHTAEEREPAKLMVQALWFALHTLLALASWATLMFLGSVLQPAPVSHWAILFATILFALVVGHMVSRFHPDEMAPVIWLLGVIWLLVMCLHVLDLPTGPNACNQCQASEKIVRTFFSFPAPSGLMDDDGPFLVTWPAAALLGYSIGAQAAVRRRRRQSR